MGAPRKYPKELMDRGMLMVAESGRPIRHFTDDLGIHPEVLRALGDRPVCRSRATPSIPR